MILNFAIFALLMILASQPNGIVEGGMMKRVSGDDVSPPVSTISTNKPSLFAVKTRPFMAEVIGTDDPCMFAFCAEFPMASCRRNSSDRKNAEFLEIGMYGVAGKLIKNCGKKCNDSCTTSVDVPHCGSNGKNYSNECELNVAKCQSKGKLGLLWRGLKCFPLDHCKYDYCARHPDAVCNLKEWNYLAIEFDVKKEKIVEAKDCDDVCGFRPSFGNCWGDWQKQFGPKPWYYDQGEKTCKQFTYGGCGGNENRFNTEKECMQKCKDFKGTNCSPKKCPDEMDEYCGTNGETYNNLCHLNVAKCNSRGTLGLKHKGACDAKKAPIEKIGLY